MSRRTAAARLPSGLLAAAAILAGRTCFSYAGDLWILFLFHLAFLAMLALAVPKPRMDAYSFLAIFLGLGFWLKFTAHQWIGYGFVEPVGAFSGDPRQWDTALAASAAAAAGVALCRALHLAWCRVRPPVPPGPLHVPAFYQARPALIWLCLTGLAVLLYAANIRFAFFVTGVDARLVLPWRLNAPAAWTVYCGMAMLVMLIADWEYQRRPQRVWPLAVATGALGMLMSVSMLSRASTLFLYVALAMACLAHRRVPLHRFWRRRGWILLPGMAAALVASLALVSVTRLHVYELPTPAAQPAPPPPPMQSHPTTPPPADIAPPATPTPPAPRAHLQMTPGLMLRQVLLLTTDRWVGLEGMLALSASEGRGAGLLRAGLVENPQSGVNAIYQDLAHSAYHYQPGFTYLTLPGFPVVLAYSGDPLVVGVGMFAACAVICLIGTLALRLTRSRLASAWLSLLLANAICQMSFPYLTLVFIVLSAVSLLAWHGLMRATAGWKKTVTQHA